MGSCIIIATIIIIVIINNISFAFLLKLVCPSFYMSILKNDRICWSFLNSVCVFAMAALAVFSSFRCFFLTSGASSGAVCLVKTLHL